MTILLSVSLCFAGIPDTGQIPCYNNAAEIPLPDVGEDFYGQDGSYAINMPSFSKLGDNGAVLDDSATEWLMVKDNVTGLIWEVKTNLDTQANEGDPHDADNTYRWYNPDDPKIQAPPIMVVVWIPINFLMH